MSRSYTVKFGADTSGFKSGTGDMIKQLNELNKALVDNKYRQKDCSKAISEAQKEIKKLEEEQKEKGKLDADEKKKLEELNSTIEQEKLKLAQLRSEQSQLRSSISSLNSELAKNDDTLQLQKKSYDQLKDAMSDTKKYSTELVKEFGAIGAAAAASVAGIYKFVGDAAKWADDIDTMHDVTGISTDDLQKFAYASDIVDVSLETMTGSLTKLTRNMQTASQNGTGAAAKAFDTLGISITDSTGKLRDRQTVFYEVIDALGKISNETERDALAMDIFGRSAEQLNPLIKGGAQTLKNLGDEAERAGLILDQRTLKKLHGFNDEVDLLKAKGTQITKLVASEAQPAVKELTAVGDELLDEIKQMADSGELREMAESAGQFIGQTARDLKNLIVWVTRHKEAVLGATGAMVGFKVGMSIGGLVNSLVAGYTALKAVTDAETASQSALNMALSSNPIGTVIGLVGALVGGFAALTAASTAVGGSVEKTNRALEAANESYSATKASVESEAMTIETLGQRYEELRKQTKLTAGEQTELKNVAEQLKAKMKLTDDQIQNSDGSYKSLTKSIQETTKAMRAQAEIEALSAGYKAAYAKQTEAQLEYEKKLEEVRKKYPELYDAKGNLNQKAYNYDTSEAVREVESLKKAYSDAGETAKWYSDKMAKATKETASLGNQTDKTSNSVDDAADKISDHTNEIKKYAEALSAGANGYSVEGLQKLFGDSIKEFLSLASDLTTTISTLSSTYEKLNEGKALDLSATLDLCTKYPEYAGALLEATGNAEKQKKIIKQLFEAKKQDLVLTLTKTRDEIEADNEVTKNTLENAKKRLKAMQNTFYRKEDINKALKAYSELQKMINELNKSYESGAKKVKNYNTQIKNINDININSFATDKSDSSPTSKSSGSSNRKSSGTTSKPKVTYTSKLYGEAGTGETQFDARMQLLDRLKAMGKLTDKQELSYLRKWRKEMKLTGDQDYTIRLRIKGLEDKAYEEKKEKEKEEKEAREKAYQKKVEQAKKEKEAKEKAERDKYDAELKYIEKKKNLGQMSAQEEIAEYNYILKHFKLTEDQKTDILVKKHNTEKKLREERYATAKAAYQKLAQDQIDIYNKTNEKIQKDADERIKAIDEETKKHNEKKEDDSRQSEIDKIDFELKYGRGDLQTQSQLRRRRQDLLNEQAEADFQRGQEDKKTNIQNEANAKIAKNTEAVDRLTQAMEKFGNYIDKVSGNQTTTQIINNNSRQQNISILRNSGTDSQLVNKLIKELI